MAAMPPPCAKAEACFFIYLILSSHVILFCTAAPGGTDAGAELPVASNVSQDKGSRMTHSLSRLRGDARLFAKPSHAVEALAMIGAGHHSVHRRLQSSQIQVINGWTFPTGTQLAFASPLAAQVFGNGGLVALDTTLMAGFKYSGIEILAPIGQQFGVDHIAATIKLVNSLAARTQCHQTFFDVAMSSSEMASSGPQASVIQPSPLAMGSTVTMVRSNNQLIKKLETPHVVFMQGGSYRLCYTPDGTFAGDEWKNALVPVLINIIGVASSCNTNDCLENEKWDCYFTYLAEIEGPCIIDLRPQGRIGWTVYSGTASMLSWTQAWPEDIVNNNDGELIQVTSRECSDTKTGQYINPETLRYNPATTPASKSILVDTSTAGTFPSLRSVASTNSFTVTACYCPNFNGQVNPQPDACQHVSEFIQPIGRVYYWMIRLCDTLNADSCGVTGAPASRVVPQQTFVLRLQCPSGGRCAETASGQTPSNRLRFIAVDLSSNRPAWDPLARCRFGDVPPATGSYLWNRRREALDGGSRRDYKIWKQRQLKWMITFGKSLDVCYCESGCNSVANYIHVGRIQSGELGVARNTPGSPLSPPLYTMKFRDKTGTINLYGGGSSPAAEGMHPYDTVKLSSRSLVKLISYDRYSQYILVNGRPVYTTATGSSVQTLEKASNLHQLSGPNAQDSLDSACATTPYPTLNNVGALQPTPLVTGLNSATDAKNRDAYIVSGKFENYLSFSGQLKDRAMNPIVAGTMSVCYCAMIIGDRCEADTYWLHAAKVLIQGPSGGQAIQLPIYTVVDFALDGWGFDVDDTLRFISETQTCGENSWNPQGNLKNMNFRLGCPGLGGADCQLQTTSENVRTIIDSGHTTGIYISGVSFNDYNASLTFTGDISGVKAHQLKMFDGITINESTVLLGGRNYSNLTAAERFKLARFTGMYDYGDDSQRTRQLVRRVSYQYRTNAGVVEVDPTKASLNVGYLASEMPVITFSGNGGNWVRRNKLRTHQEFLADSTVKAKICYGVSDRDLNPAERKYYADAGTIEFVAPSRMDFVGVGFTSRVKGTIAPTTIAFVPKRGRAGYVTFTIPLVVRILFHDTTGKLEPVVSGDASTSILEPLSSNASVAMENATQVLCGKMFNEMWTNDAAGFPLPRGCYYGLQYQNAPHPQTSQPSPTWREYFIVFEPQRGLKSTCFDYRLQATSHCLYMFVINAHIKTVVPSAGAPPGSEVVSVFVNCAPQPGGTTPCGPEYYPLEYGVAQVNIWTEDSDNSTGQIAYGEVGEQGSIRNQTIAQSLTLDAPDFLGTRPWGLEVRVWPRDLTTPIAKGSYLRIFFSPLTMWEIGRTACTAVCIPPDGYSCSDGRSGSSGKCTKASVMATVFDAVVRMPRNVLQLEYPRAMDEIRLSNISNATDQQLMYVPEQVTLPDQGFFPTRFLLQLSDDVDRRPSIGFTTTYFSMIPKRGSTVGRLLTSGQTGSGARPFIQDRGNQMIVYFTLGLTLRNNASGLPSYQRPRFEVELPFGYTCYIYKGGAVNHSTLFLMDRDADGYADFRNFSLQMGSWFSSERKCWYTLDDDAAIFAGQRFFLMIEVDNPAFPLRRNEARNNWTMVVKTVGAIAYGPPETFINLVEEQQSQHLGWQGNLAVIQPLQGENIQPTLFNHNAKQWLHVFFKAVHYMPPFSYVVIDSPYDFDFGDCLVHNLPVDYYADWHALPWGEELIGPRSKARPLGAIHSCTGDVWGRDPFDPAPTGNFTRAQIRLVAAILADAEYAFQIHVRSARAFNFSQHDNWRIWIRDPQNYIADGSRYSAQFSASRLNTVPSAAYDRSWAIYEESLKGPVTVDFGSAAIFPTLQTGITTFVTVYPLEIHINRFVAIRVIAPVGYVWDLSPADGFVGNLPGTTCSLCNIPVTPTVHFLNELILTDTPLRGGLKYGFRARMNVPRRPPTRSTNAFSIEIGYKERVGTSRVQAGLLPTPRLRVLYDARIVSLCNVNNYALNIFEFHLRTVSDLGPQDGFIFRGDEGTRSTNFACPPKAAPGVPALPIDLQCQLLHDQNTGLPIIILGSLFSNFPAGLYGFSFHNTINPDAPGGVVPSTIGGSWTFGTYRSIASYPQLQTADVSIVVPAPRVQAEMRMAGIVDPPEWQKGSTGRDDRPGRFNRLIFYFKLRSAATFPISVSTLSFALRGPTGFLFDDDCLHVLHALNVTDVPKPVTTTTTLPFITYSTSTTTLTYTTGEGINCSNDTVAVVVDEQNLLYNHTDEHYNDNHTTTTLLLRNWTCRTYTTTTTTPPTTSTSTTSTTSTTLTNTTTLTTTTTANSTWPCMPTNFNTKSWCNVVIQDWPDPMRPSSCTGLGNTAKITIPNPLNVFFLNDTFYGFQIGMTNPIAMNATSISDWALDFASEASLPISTFAIRTFDPATTTMIVVSSAAIVAAPATYHSGTPMSITFTPSLTVPSIQFGLVIGGRRLQNVPANADEGYLLLNAPSGFLFSISDAISNSFDPICSRAILEVNGRAPQDTAGLFVEALDMKCRVKNMNVTQITLHGTKALISGVTYRFLFYVNNPSSTQPASSWLLRSFKTKVDPNAPEYGQTIPLDMFTFPGFRITAALPQFSYINLSGEYNGGFEVRRLRFTLVFTENVMNGDQVEIQAPTGFKLLPSSSSVNSIGPCMHFKYPTAILPLLSTPDPICHCTVGQDGYKCKLVFTMQENSASGIALLPSSPLTFDFGGTNPLSTPDEIHNNWEASHKRSAYVVASRVSNGWLVYAQPQNISVAITGIYVRATSISELTISFTPTVFALAIDMSLYLPSGFDFTNAQPVPPFQLHVLSSGGRLVLIGGQFIKSQPISITIKNVRLGNVGGGTMMNFEFFTDVAMTKPTGRRFNFTRGFRLPGSLAITSQHLLSLPVVAHYEQPNQTDAVLPSLPVQNGDIARYELTFTVTMPVFQGSVLYLRTEGVSTGQDPYALLTASQYRPTLKRCGPSPSTQSPHTSCNVAGDVNITNVYHVMQGLGTFATGLEFQMTLAHAGTPTAAAGGGMTLVFPSSQTPVLETGVTFRLRGFCRPNGHSVNWRMQVIDGQPLPLNTNDGITPAIKSVIPMTIDLWAIRTPPSSMISSRLTISPGPFGTAVEEVQLILPVGYTRHKPPPTSSVFSGTYLSTGRVIAPLPLLPSARLALPKAGAVLTPQVMSPPSTPVDKRFFVTMYTWPTTQNLVKTPANAQLLAWGSFSGWILDALNATITYANIEEFTGHVAVYFGVPLLATGAYAVIRAPLGFVLGCPGPQAGVPPPPCRIRPREANLSLAGQGQPEGQTKAYSFTVPMTTPLLPPVVNNWDVRIYDKDLYVVDGVVGISKNTYVPSVYMKNPFITWINTPQRGESATLRITVQLTRRLWAVRAILISMPEGYRHDIQHQNQFKSKTKTFPIAIDIPWRNYQNLRWVRMLIANAPSSVDFVPADTYIFELPVMVPVFQPLASEWYFSICKTYTCTTPVPPDPSIEVTFPMINPSPILPQQDFRPSAVTAATNQWARCKFDRILILLSFTMCLQS